MKYICDYCGKPTDNDQSFNLDGTIYESHRCDKCNNRLDDLIDWQNEQWRENTTTCPWCGYEFEDYENEHEEGEIEVKCPVCEKHFEVEAECSWLFTSRKPERLFEEEGEQE